MEILEIFICAIILTSVPPSLQQMGQSRDKIVKVKNRDLELKCLLNETHEKFNKNSTVTWWLKNSCKFPQCLVKSSNTEFEEISCDSCGTSMILDDLTAQNGIYLCKISPYRLNSQIILQVQFTKSFHVSIEEGEQLNFKLKFYLNNDHSNNPHRS